MTRINSDFGRAILGSQSGVLGGTVLMLWFILACGGAEKEKKCLEMAKSKKFEVYFYCVSGDLNGAPMYEEYVRDNVAQFF